MIADSTIAMREESGLVRTPEKKRKKIRDLFRLLYLCQSSFILTYLR